MNLKKIEGPRAVTLKDGTVMTQADLPPKSTRRWVTSRKTAVVKAVRIGLITDKDAYERLGLSQEELNQWVCAVHTFGEVALNATSVQRYRQL